MGKKEILYNYNANTSYPLNKIKPIAMFFLVSRFIHFTFKWLSFFIFQRVRLSEVKRQEQELLENQSIPLRNYLMKHVMPTLAQGLIECCKTRPDDPVDFVVS